MLMLFDGVNSFNKFIIFKFKKFILLPRRKFTQNPMTRKRIIIAPLNWGIGHATRCVPIVHKLLEKKQDVLIASDGRAMEFMKKEFPKLKHINLPGYNIVYQKNDNFSWHLGKQIPKIFKNIANEHKRIEEICREYKIDGIISDNRFGLWHKDIPSVFLTHQINIKANSAFIEKLIRPLNHYYIKKFSHCWIPDFPPPNSLSADLATIPTGNEFFSYIGALSRFKKNLAQEKIYDFLAIISGPEPQRSIFENKILMQVQEQTDLKGVVLRGLPENEENKKQLTDRVTIYPHLGSEKIDQLISQSTVVLSRSGYSTIMDLSVHGSRAVFIPTPGQTEQEFLANYHTNKGHTAMQYQAKMNIKEGIEQAKKAKGVPKMPETNYLDQKLDDFLLQCTKK